MLPADNNDLEHFYTELEEINITQNDNTQVGQTGTTQYMVHQFKRFVGTAPFFSILCEATSSLAPRLQTVYLQVYNFVSHTWDTHDFNNRAHAYIHFELTANLTSMSKYKNSSNVVMCRVYQKAL